MEEEDIIREVRFHLCFLGVRVEVGWEEEGGKKRKSSQFEETGIVGCQKPVTGPQFPPPDFGPNH